MDRSKKNDKSVGWNSDTAHALRLYKILLSILGIWPLKCQDLFSKIRLVTVVFLEMSMMISLIVETGSECSSIQDIILVISLVGCSILALLKVTMLRVFHPKMLKVITMALEDWRNVEAPSGRLTMLKHAKLGRKVLIFQMTFAYITTVPMIIGALPFLAPQANLTTTNETLNSAELRGFPLPTSCIFANISDVLYAIVFTIQALQLIATCTANVGIDVYFFGMAMHLCGQFELLGEDFEKFSINENEHTERENLLRLVRRHVKLCEIARYLEDSFNFLILVQFSTNAFQMCLIGIQMILSLQSGDTVTVVNTIIMLCVTSLQLFCYSYAGDRLSSQMANLRFSAYFSPWYEMSPNLAKDVLFIIMRNHQSFNITAGKVYNIDIDNFKNLIKALGSYFSVLRIMFET